MENLDFKTENEKLKAENENLRKEFELLKSNSNIKTQAEQPKAEQKNEFEKYRQEQEEKSKKVENENFLINEFTKISFIYQTAFSDSIDRIEKMGSLTTKDKIETMARDIILKANNNEETINRLKKLNNSSVLDDSGAVKYMFEEAIKNLKSSKTTKTNYLRNRATTEELRELSNSLFDGSRKEQAKERAKNLGLIN